MHVGDGADRRELEGQLIRIDDKAELPADTARRIAPHKLSRDRHELACGHGPRLAPRQAPRPQLAREAVDALEREGRRLPLHLVAQPEDVLLALGLRVVKGLMEDGHAQVAVARRVGARPVDRVDAEDEVEVDARVGRGIAKRAGLQVPPSSERRVGLPVRVSQLHVGVANGQSEARHRRGDQCKADEHLEAMRHHEGTHGGREAVQRAVQRGDALGFAEHGASWRAAASARAAAEA